MAIERSFFLIKPDGIQRGLIAEILGRIERTGLKLVGCKFLVPQEDQCWKHYNKDDAWFTAKGTRMIDDLKSQGKEVTKEAIEYGKDILRGNITLLTSGPVFACVWEGNQAVSVIKKIVGTTESATSPVGTIRGDLSNDSYELCALTGRAVRNLVHCSDSVAEAEREIALWMRPEDLVNYTTTIEKALYDTDLSFILK